LCPSISGYELFERPSDSCYCGQKHNIPRSNSQSFHPIPAVKLRLLSSSQSGSVPIWLVPLICYMGREICSCLLLELYHNCNKTTLWP